MYVDDIIALAAKATCKHQLKFIATKIYSFDKITYTLGLTYNVKIGAMFRQRQVVDLDHKF